MKHMTHTTAMLLAFCAWSGQAAHAQFDPAKVVPELPAIAARFTPPPVTYNTPGFLSGRTDFPSHAEVMVFADDLMRQSPHLKVESLGRTQQGLVMPLLLLADQGRFDARRPTVLVIGQQHGNEPAGGEAALVLAQQFAGPRADLLKKINLLIIPRGNPDGAERFVRVTASGIDVNRDHLLLNTPEGRMIADVAMRYHPQVVMDLHEFTVAGRWAEKFGVAQKYDGLLQPATVGNLDPQLAVVAQAQYIEGIQTAFSKAGLTAFKYHTTASGSVNDKSVAMGGVQPDTGRNVSGLRPAISLLLEVRGVGLGRSNFARRVYTQVLAASTVIETAARQGQSLIDLIATAENNAIAQACRGDVVVEAWQTPTRQKLEFLDAMTGADKVIEVDWRSADTLKVVNSRPRPCGYLLAPTEAQAATRLAQLGARVERVQGDALWAIERYQIEAQEAGQREDGRGAIQDGQAIRRFKVSTQAGQMAVPAGSYYVTLAQPLSPLLSAALEPDSQNSYAANRLLDIANDRLLRVMAVPAAAQLSGLSLH
jgi:hypothetical protein